MNLFSNPQDVIGVALAAGVVVFVVVIGLDAFIKRITGEDKER